MKILSMMSAKESMRQMGLQDNPQFLKKLSQDKSISFFENIFIVYSYEDGYSPLPSSKIVEYGLEAGSAKMCGDFWDSTKVDFIHVLIS